MPGLQSLQQQIVKGIAKSHQKKKKKKKKQQRLIFHIHELR
jgi:hypothetical protein